MVQNNMALEVSNGCRRCREVSMLPGKVACKLPMPANTSPCKQGSGAADAADAQGGSLVRKTLVHQVSWSGLNV